MFCPNCGVENQDTAVECRRCHVPFQEDLAVDAHAAPAAEAPVEANDAGAICGRCETFNEPGVERCTTCGYPLVGAAEPTAHEHEHEQATAHDTPAEATSGLADEVDGLAISADEAHAAHGEDAHAAHADEHPAPHHDDATPADGLAPVAAEAEQAHEHEHVQESLSAEPAFEPTPTRRPVSSVVPVSAPRTAAPIAAPVAAPIAAAPISAPAATEKTCASCASINLPNAKFCAECGTPFPKNVAAAPAAVAPVVAAASTVIAHEEPAHVEAPNEEMHAAASHEESHEEAHAQLHDDAPAETHEEESSAPEFDAQKTDPSMRARVRGAEVTAEHPPLELAEEPAHEELAHEEPAHEELAHEELAHEESAHEESAHEELAHEESAHEELAHEEPAHEEPAHEEPAHEEPAHEEELPAAAAEVPAEEEFAAAAEAPAEEPVAQEPVAQEPPFTVQLVVEQGAHAGTSFQLLALENTIGGADASVELTDDQHVAGHHATVYFEEQRLILRDEGAPNGVFVKLREPTAIEPGDQFIAGERLLRFEGPVELGTSEVAEPPFQGSPRPPANVVRVVEMLAGGKLGRSCHRAGPVIAVGKTGCDLNFPADPLLAGRHAEIHLAEDGTASIVDLGTGESGVLLRLAHGAAIELQTGDLLQIGTQVMRVEM